MISAEHALAITALDQGRPQKALDHLADVDDVDDPNVWYLRAAALRLLERPDAACDAARRGLAIDPDDVGLSVQLAEAHADADRPADAERVLLATLGRRPHDAGVLRSYGAVLVQAGESQAALDVLDRLDPADADDHRVLTLRAQAEFGLGRRRRAERLLDRAQELDPEAAQPHVLRAVHGATAGDVGTVIEAAERAARLDPDHAAEVGREARLLAHPLMAPMRLIERIGVGPLWLTWLVLFFGGRRVWPEGPWGWIILGYLGLVLYSWAGPPLLRAWFRWRGRL